MRTSKMAANDAVAVVAAPALDQAILTQEFGQACSSGVASTMLRTAGELLVLAASGSADTNALNQWHDVLSKGLLAAIRNNHTDAVCMLLAALDPPIVFAIVRDDHVAACFRRGNDVVFRRLHALGCFSQPLWFCRGGWKAEATAAVKGDTKALHWLACTRSGGVDEPGWSLEWAKVVVYAAEYKQPEVVRWVWHNDGHPKKYPALLTPHARGILVSMPPPGTPATSPGPGPHPQWTSMAAYETFLTGTLQWCTDAVDVGALCESFLTESSCATTV
jgi:hypothetical protein